MNRILLIRTSLKIFSCGMAGLVPLLGIVPAICAIFNATRLGKNYRKEWNPASAYLNWGVTLALFSLSLNLLAAAVVILNLLPPYVQN
jgi:hypothetical protein